MIEALEVFYPVLPPTANRIYVRGSVLRQEAREYKETFKKVLHQQYGHVIQQLPDPKKDPNLVFWLSLTFYMNCLNASWRNMKLPPTRRSEDRFKKIDLTNRIKFFEDCIRDAVGIDDSLTFAASQSKYHSLTEGVHFRLKKADPRTFGIELVEGG